LGNDLQGRARETADLSFLRVGDESSNDLDLAISGSFLRTWQILKRIIYTNGDHDVTLPDSYHSDQQNDED